MANIVYPYGAEFADNVSQVVAMSSSTLRSAIKRKDALFSNWYAEIIRVQPFHNLSNFVGY